MAAWRHIWVISAFLPFLLFTACGGDEEPPPLATNPTSKTPDIKEADKKLDDALNKCKGGVMSSLPSLMGGMMGSGSTGTGSYANYGTGTTNTGFSTFGTGSSSPFGTLGSSSSSPTNPQALLSSLQKSGCYDDLTVALLLWKSARKTDDSLAIYDSWYRDYLMKKIKDFITKAGGQTGLPPDQQAKLAELLKGVFTNEVLAKSGVPGSQAIPLLSLLNKASPSTIPSYLKPKPQLPTWLSQLLARRPPNSRPLPSWLIPTLLRYRQQGRPIPFWLISTYFPSSFGPSYGHGVTAGGQQLVDAGELAKASGHGLQQGP